MRGGGHAGGIFFVRYALKIMELSVRKKTMFANIFLQLQINYRKVSWMAYWMCHRTGSPGCLHFANEMEGLGVGVGEGQRFQV